MLCLNLFVNWKGLNEASEMKKRIDRLSDQDYQDSVNGFLATQELIKWNRSVLRAAFYGTPEAVASQEQQMLDAKRNFEKNLSELLSDELLPKDQVVKVEKIKKDW